jgi:hypothetical protein
MMDKTRRPKHRPLFSLLLVVALLAALMLPAGCTTNQSNATSTATTESRRYLSETDLIQLIALAINRTSEPLSVFEEIPERQRSGMTADQFTRYIQLLRRGVTERILSFNPMTGADLARMREEIQQKLPEQQDLTSKTIGYWLNFGEAGTTVNQMAIFCQKHEDGYTYLDLEWITQVLRIGDFFELYFNALDQRDIPALDELLRTTVPDPVSRSSIASTLTWFYRNQVETRPSAFRMLSARIDGISFRQKLVAPLNFGTGLYRTITFSPDPNGQFTVDDFLPSELAEMDTQVFFDGEAIFTVGQIQGDGTAPPVASSTLDARIGEPIYHDDFNCLLQADGESLIRLNYANGLDLTARGTCTNHLRWRGRVTAAKLKSPGYALGSGLNVGDRVETLYALYPLIGVGDQNAQQQTPGGRVELTVSVLDGRVSEIRLAIAE